MNQILDACTYIQNSSSKCTPGIQITEYRLNYPWGIPQVYNGLDTLISIELATVHRYTMMFLYSLRSLCSACSTVVSVRHRLPVSGQIHHIPGIQHSVAKQVVELQACAIDGPVVFSMGVVQMVPLGGENCQMLHVSPGEPRAVINMYMQLIHSPWMPQTLTSRLCLAVRNTRWVSVCTQIVLIYC